MRISIICHEINFEAVPIVGLDWYNGINGNMSSQGPNLAIAFENGKAQLMKNENDTSEEIAIFYIYRSVKLTFRSSHS